jgi:hypothetical protein
LGLGVRHRVAVKVVYVEVAGMGIPSSAVHLEDRDLGEGHQYHTRERSTRLRGPVG